MDAYVGFSTLEFQNKKSFILRNVEIIKQDLLNNIFTRPSERVMMCAYGTRIPDLIGEPLDEASVFIVQQDLTQVFDNDPRVKLIDLRVIPLYDQNTIMAFANLSYTYLNFSDTFSINISFLDSNQ